MIDASLNEVESVAAKAARGSGLAWGISEDVGKAARWLAAHDLPWASSLIELLRGADGFATPIASIGFLRPSDKSRNLSPLICGPYIADARISGSQLRLERIAWPMWLLPFVERVAKLADQTLRVEWGNASATLSSAGFLVETGDDLTAGKAVDAIVAVAPFGVQFPPRVPIQPRSRISMAHWRMIDEIGARTYVASSAQSRSKGAGAGLVDID